VNIRIALFVSVALAGSVQAQTQPAPSRVSSLLRRAIILDLHDDTTQMILDEGYDFAGRHQYGQVDLPRMRDGHVTGLFFSIWTDPLRYTPAESIRRALEQIDRIRRVVAAYPRDIVLAATADQVLTARKRGQVAALMGLEGGQMIDSDLAVLRNYYSLGVRYMTLTHTEHTPWADSSSHPPVHNGLTDFGKQVVREMNRLGMMVDISHVSDKTFYDALETSAAPVIASHSSCRAIDDVPRNMTDDMLRALAKNGGVVHINFFEGFLDSDFAQRFAALKDEQAEQDAAEAQAPKFGARSTPGAPLSSVASRSAVCSITSITRSR